MPLYIRYMGKSCDPNRPCCCLSSKTQSQKQRICDVQCSKREKRTLNVRKRVTADIYVKKAEDVAKKAGPKWFQPISNYQISILKSMASHLQWDFLTGKPTRTSNYIAEFGVWPRIPEDIVYDAMFESNCQGPEFMWELTQYHFKFNPSDLKKEYGSSQRLMMSAIAYMCLEEGLEELTRRFHAEVEDHEVIAEVKELIYAKRYNSPYLVPVVPYKPHGRTWRKKERRSGKSLPDRNETSRRRQKLAAQSSTQILVRDRKSKTMDIKDIFRMSVQSEGRASVVIMTPNEMNIMGRGRRGTMYAAYEPKPRKPRPWKRPPIPTPPPAIESGLEDNGRSYIIAGVQQIDNKLVYVINGVSAIPRDYDVIHGGVASVKGENIPIILGIHKDDVPSDATCCSTCYCINWYKEVIDYVNQTECHCVDVLKTIDDALVLSCSSNTTARSNTNLRCFDYTGIIEMDAKNSSNTSCCCHGETVELLNKNKKPLEEVLNNVDIPHVESEIIEISDNKMDIYSHLKAVLQDMGDDGYLLGKLPEIDKLPVLREWMRHRAKGEMTEEELRKLVFRRSVDYDFWVRKAQGRIKMPRDTLPIPNHGYTEEEVKKLTWKDKEEIDKKMQEIRKKFIAKFKGQVLKFTREFWSSLDNEKHGNEAFDEAFYTYMPTRKCDMYMTRSKDRRFIEYSKRLHCNKN